MRIISILWGGECSEETVRQSGIGKSWKPGVDRKVRPDWKFSPAEKQARQEKWQKAGKAGGKG
jgi:hypothetical protein